jgi:zinc protease
MFNRPRRVTRLVCLILVSMAMIASSASAKYELVAGPAVNDSAGVHIYRLENGLTVYLTENHQTPRFYSEIVVRAGHKQDPATNTGLAHYLEHLLFKGSQKMGTIDFEKEREHIEKINELYQQRFLETDPVKRDEIYAQINELTQASDDYVVPNEMGSLYKQMGGWGLNAHTWYEETVYKIGLPANRLKQWAVIESDRFADPVFRLFVTELEVVYEEKNRSMDNKDRLVFEAMGKMLFKHHPYGQQTTLGDIEHLKNPSLQAVRDYYETYYVPNNMAVVISGDIDIETTIELIDKHFSSWQAKPLPEPKVYEEEPLTKREHGTVSFDAEPYVLMGYRVPGRNDQDAEAMVLADMVLANSTAGLIDINLVQSQKLRTAGASPYQLNDYGWEIFWATPKDGQTHEEAEALLIEQIEKLKAGEFDQTLLDGIISNLKKDEKQSLESDKGRVAMIRNAFLAGQDWSHVVSRLDRMAGLTRQDVVDAANKYFGDGYVVVYRVQGEHKIPEIKKPNIDPIDIDPTRQSPFARQVLEMPVDPIEPTFVVKGKDYTVSEYADGVDFYYVPNPINDLFTLSFVIETGTRHDKSLSMASRLMNQAGTAQHSPQELKKAWFALGTDLSIGTDGDRTTLSISGLDENLEPSLALLMELLQTPTVDGQVLSDMVENFITQRQESKKSHRTLASALRELARFGDESKYIDTLSNEELRSLTTAELFGKATSLLKYQHNIRYTGSLPADEVVALLRSYHPVADDLRAPPAYRPRPVRVPEETEVRLFDKQMAQALVYVDMPAEVYDEAQAPGVGLYNQYFGGMSGVAYQELREARALAYVVGARYITAGRTDEHNNMVGLIGCQADKTSEAVDGLLGLIDDMPVSDDRFEQGKASLVNSYRTSKIGFRGILGAVDGWQRLGLSDDPRPVRFQAVQAADIQTLTGFFQTQIKGRPKYIAVVGDKTKIDLEKLGAYGEVKEMTLDQLFGY